MLLLLIVGITCLAISAFQLTRPRAVADRDRRVALERVRSAADAVDTTPDARRSPLGRVPALLAAVHRRLWPRGSDHDITTALLRAGASQRLTAEIFMAGRVALTGFGIFAGFTLAHGVGRILLALVFGLAGILFPGFFLSKAATRRAEKIDTELPHFVDQLALVIEAGMSFDAALTYLADVGEGPLSEEMRRVLTELRVGESRKTAIRNFAIRVGSVTLVENSLSKRLRAQLLRHGRAAFASCAFVCRTAIA